MSSGRQQQDENQFFFQVILVVSFIFIAWVLFALARSIYRDSFQVGSYIGLLQDRIATEQQLQLGKQDELAYAETPQFREKVAKTFLGLHTPGEEVIILSTEEQNLDNLLPEETRTFRREQELLTPPQKWLRYIFGI